MKINYTVALVLALAVLGMSLQARRGGGGGGHRGGGGRGYHGGGYRRGYYGGRGWGRGWGYGPYSGVGFSVSSAPSYGGSCAYASPSDSYSVFLSQTVGTRRTADPEKNADAYYSWLRNNRPDWQNEWSQFQAYLNYRSCAKQSNKPQVGVSFGVGTGGGYGYRRGWW